eukprot:3937966-Rhodomonas_salina.1
MPQGSQQVRPPRSRDQHTVPVHVGLGFGVFLPSDWIVSLDHVFEKESCSAKSKSLIEYAPPRQLWHQGTTLRPTAVDSTPCTHRSHWHRGVDLWVQVNRPRGQPMGQ